MNAACNWMGGRFGWMAVMHRKTPIMALSVGRQGCSHVTTRAWIHCESGSNGCCSVLC